jgi:hypothetical protein
MVRLRRGCWLLALVLAGCSDQPLDVVPPSASDGMGRDAVPADAPFVPISGASPQVRDEITVASWNIQVLGESKIDVLDDVIRLVRDADSEDDVNLLGDLNAAPQHLGELADIPNIMWTVTGTPTNTRGTRTYDNMLFSGTSTSEFTGVAGVLDLQVEYDLTQQQAIRVSDHRPVWAAFAPVERTARIASGAGNRR